MSEILIYEQEGRPVEVRLEGDTVWLTQRQMADLLDTSSNNIGMHINGIYSDEELAEGATTKESLVVQTEGNRSVSRNVKHYNLDMIISVAYRVNSKRGVRFRQWATGVLREHLTQGYTLNHQRLESNARELEAALRLVQQTAQTAELTADVDRRQIIFRDERRRYVRQRSRSQNARPDYGKMKCKCDTRLIFTPISKMC